MTDSPEEETFAEVLWLLESTDRNIFLSVSDDVLKLLADEHRRQLIYYLSDQETATPLSRTAMELINRVNDVPLTDVTPAAQEQMQVSLEHHHLPRLTDTGLLSWSHGDEMIEPLPAIDDVAQE